MSVAALDWAIRKAPVGNNTTMRMILTCLAHRANDDGTAACLFVSEIVEWTRMSESTVRRALAALEKQGVIRRGDQRLVDHYPRWARPVVWDLDMGLEQDPLPRKPRRAHRPHKRTAKPAGADETVESTIMADGPTTGRRENQPTSDGRNR